MVFFTCNKCGESLKKKDVEKHCNTRCRGPPYLTCVDCLKDFCEDFVKHTVCVSEDDRYSALGLKGLQGKQKTKQQLWVETVQDCISRAIDDGVPGMTPSLRSLMLYLQEQPTLPDKAKAFTNFIKNARRSEPIQNIEFVWKILETARSDLQAKQKAEREAAEAERRKAREQQKQQKREESSESSGDDSSDSENEGKSLKNGAGKKEPESHDDASNGFSNGKKDKKKKRMVSESESLVNGSSEFRKTKKKKRNPESECQETESTSNLNNAMDACHLNIQGAVNEDQKLTKKEKKDKKKRGKYEAELKEIESAEAGEQANALEGQEEAMEDDSEGKKGKKKKKNKKSAEVIPSVDEGSTEGVDKKKKEKKSKKKGHQQDEDEEMDTGSKPQKTGKSANGKLNETLDLEAQEKVKFSWDTAILQVLESQEEISFKRLSKKIINEYLLSLGENEHVDEAKIMTKFQKRLEKMHNVLFYKDKVRLKTSRD